MDTAGLHDPYWYEGSVGLLSTIDMLNPDSEIETVTFQKTGTKGLDDVVIAHRNGRTIYTQIKHTRADNTLTFGDLVSRPRELVELVELGRNWGRAKKNTIN